MHLRLVALGLATALLGLGCPPGGQDAGTDNDDNQTNNEATEGCAELTPLWSATTEPSAVSIHLSAHDCETGEPVDHLGDGDFEVVEDGSAVDPAAADIGQLSNTAIRPYVLLVVDVADADPEEIRDGARNLVDEFGVDQPGSNVHFGIVPGGEFDQGQRPVADADTLDEFIDEMSTVDEADALQSFERASEQLRDHLKTVAQRNDDGVVPMGHAVVWTDDADAAETEIFADRVAADRSGDREAGPGVAGWALPAGDEVRGDLDEAFGGEHWIREADGIAEAVEREIDRSLLVGYCSQLRSDGASVEISLTDRESEPAGFSVDAGDFEEGCDIAALESACTDRECGGLHCGGCLDTRDICGGPAGEECVHYCVDQLVCTDETITNDLGHEQGCHMGPEIIACDETCVDTEQNDQHCGECDNACTAPSSHCELGECICEGGDRDCDGTCIDLQADDDHCGACDHACPDDIECVDGQCPCGDGTIACDGTCVDTSDHDDHCGECFNDCGPDQQCDGGTCRCVGDLDTCGGECVDLQADDDHCGACDNSCGEAMACIQGLCRCEATGEALCDGACIDVLEDDDNCGDCDNSCGADQSCSGGECVCDDGDLTNCQGTCVDTDDNDDYCGGCDNACDESETCENGTCELLPILDERLIRAGEHHTCALDVYGSPVCWGANDEGQSDAFDYQYRAIAPGDSYTCGVLNSDGAPICWGQSIAGEIFPPDDLELTDVAAAYSHSCGIETDGSVTCWGSDEDGKSTPPDEDFDQVGLGFSHTCGLQTDGSLTCWGDDSDGKTDPPAGDFEELAVGMNHACAIETDGELACWGREGLGQTDPPAGTFEAVAAGGAHTCAVAEDGAVHCWGSDTNGQGESGVPDGEFEAVAAGFQHSCGLETDGDVACWGTDGEGQLGFPGW